MAFGTGVVAGTAYIELRAKLDRFKRDLDQTIGPVDRMGGKLNQSFQKAVGPSKALLLGVGGVATALGGIAAAGGVSRLIGIEDAEKRMKAMGLETKQVSELSEGLLRVLEGTPYALDEGAGSMAKMVSAGRDLSEIETTMGLIADTAAFAQAPMSEVADIFGKIQTQGRLTATEIMQFETRGVPALRMLADAAGVSGLEMREMISKGKIDAETFFKLYEEGAEGFGEENIRLAGSAKEMGDTTSGAFANMKTAMSRFGADALEPIFEQAKHVFNGISDWLDEMGDRVGPMVEQWADKIPAALSVVSDLLGDDLHEKLKMVGAAIAGMLVPAVLALTFAAGRLVLALGPWAILGVIALKLYELYQNSEKFRRALELLRPVIVAVGAMLATHLAAKKLQAIISGFSILANTAAPRLAAALGGPTGLGVVGFAVVGMEIDKVIDRFEGQGSIQSAIGRGVRTAMGVIPGLGGAFNDLTDHVKDTTEATKEYKDAVKAAMSPAEKYAHDIWEANAAHEALNPELLKTKRYLNGISNALSNKFNWGVAGQQAGDGIGMIMAGAGTPQGMMNAAIAAVGGGLTPTSGYRPGAITSSGFPSLHGLAPPNNAWDFSGPPAQMLAAAKYLANTFGPGIRELIYTPLGYSIKDGKKTAPLAASAHYDHVHIADQGGWFKGPGLLAMGRGYEMFAGGLQAAKKVGDVPAQSIVVNISTGDVIGDADAFASEVVGLIQDGIRKATPV